MPGDSTQLMALDQARLDRGNKGVAAPPPDLMTQVSDLEERVAVLEAKLGIAQDQGQPDEGPQEVANATRN